MTVAVNARVQACARAIGASATPGVREIVPAISSLGIHVDPLRIVLPDLLRVIDLAIETSRHEPFDEAGEGLIVSIPVCYGADVGPDLPDLARWAGLSEQEVCERHAAPTYRVFMIGFSPGFGYLGPVDPVIAMPRLDVPRLRVEAGSVGIAGSQTGVYPRGGPGGWRIIGRTRTRLFDPDSTPPALLRAGQRVRFVPIGAGELETGSHQ